MSRFGYRSNGTRSRGDVLPENDSNLRSRDVELRFFAGLAVEETAPTPCTRATTAVPSTAVLTTVNSR